MSTEVGGPEVDPQAVAAANELGTLTALTPQQATDFQSSHPLLAARRWFAEFLGTFFLVLVGAGTAVIGARYPNQISTPVAGAAVGLTILVLILALGKISGAHFNPAVTFAVALRGVFPWARVPAYLISQLVGAVLAIVVLRCFIGDYADLGTITPTVNHVEVWFWEALLSFGLITVILAVINGAMNVGSLSAFAIGGYFAFAVMVFGYMTGPALNPFRQLAPALVSGQYHDIVAYVLAPLVGAAVAVGVGIFLRGAPKKDVAAKLGAQGDISDVYGK